ncbi:MAG: dockerin type I repeat-containing protein, partial [Clostridia bacterium]|nr:dockerin type I repeat-containing protein [Clostridia bacterium]
ELINAVAGTGWTDTAGTTGKATIAISTTGQNVSSYKKVYFTPHTHDFTYSADGAAITATCTVDGCMLTDSRATLTIVAPTLTVYGGTGSAAATLDGLDAFNAATGLNVDADSIVYWKAKIIEGVYKTDGNEPLAGAPTNAGNYLSKITVSNCIASVGYTIAKADPSYTVPTDLTATYGDTLADVELPAGWAWDDDAATSVGNVGTNTFKATFTPTDTANYNTVSGIDVTVTVNHIPGDIDGDGEVNNKDLTRLFQYLSDWDVEVNEAALDVNGDGKVNNKDLTRLFQYLSDWDVEIF